MRKLAGLSMIFIISQVMFVCFTSTIAAQSVSIDALSARTESASSTVKMPVFVAVPTGVFPTSVQFDITIETTDLKFFNLNDGPAATAAGKTARGTIFSANRMQIIVEGRGTDPINSGTLVIVELSQLALSPRVSPVVISASQVLDAAGRRLNSTSSGARAILQEGIRIPSCPTTLPAECRGNQLVIAEGVNPTNEILFAQMASGVQSAQFGGYETKILITNLIDSAGDVLVEFFGQTGQPLNTTIGDDLDNAFYYRIPAKGTLVVETNSLGPVAVGWIRLKSLVSLGGSILYSYLNPDRQRISEAGILPSTYRTSFDFTVDTRSDMNVGLAASNSTLNLMTLNCSLYNQAGAPIGQRNLTLPGMGQLSLVIEQIFPGVDFRNFIGKVNVKVVGQGYVAATTLRFSNDLRIFASLPVI